MPNTTNYPPNPAIPLELQAHLDNLLSAVEADFGFDYSIAEGTRSLVELRKLIGGEPSSNMLYYHQP